MCVPALLTSMLRLSHLPAALVMLLSLRSLDPQVDRLIHLTVELVECAWIQVSQILPIQRMSVRNSFSIDGTNVGRGLTGTTACSGSSVIRVL